MMLNFLKCPVFKDGICDATNVNSVLKNGAVTQLQNKMEEWILRNHSMWVVNAMC